MFETKTYIGRRKELTRSLGSGIILLPGNNESPMNYAGNTYPFRQDSTFLYFFGLDHPGFTGLIDVEAGESWLFGDDFTLDDIIWMGPQPTVAELGARAGVEKTGSPAELQQKIEAAIAKGRHIHYLPPYRAENALRLEKLLGIAAPRLKPYASRELISAVIAQREIKSPDEIHEIEKALAISHAMYSAALKHIKPGLFEYQIVGKMQEAVYGANSHNSFHTILSVNGETLHNHSHSNLMEAGKLLVVDSGAESPLHYASDITRTFPVSGVFTHEQKEIYEVVLNGQMAATEAIKPGASYREIHLNTARVMADSLKAAGFMKGDMAAAVAAGAHALFFPHGLGHMIGLDVHDMEDLGENYVGYDNTVQRSNQFGLAYLRMAKTLKPGFVLTVEPGCYFIPALIDKWKQEGLHTEFINYGQVEKFRGFGGIRIEDNVLVTPDGQKTLGRPIPKTVKDIEAAMN